MSDDEKLLESIQASLKALASGIGERLKEFSSKIDDLEKNITNIETRLEKLEELDNQSKKVK